ncbi:hypothetical protein KM043_016264 [Ampulex compressa]|nr:hypothetical protein KM043_016264 [Ampulex compressa]
MAFSEYHRAAPGLSKYETARPSNDFAHEPVAVRAEAPPEARVLSRESEGNIAGHDDQCNLSSHESETRLTTENLAMIQSIEEQRRKSNSEMFASISSREDIWEYKDYRNNLEENCGPGEKDRYEKGRNKEYGRSVNGFILELRNDFSGKSKCGIRISIISLRDALPARRATAASKFNTRLKRCGKRWRGERKKKETKKKIESPVLGVFFAANYRKIKKLPRRVPRKCNNRSEHEDRCHTMNITDISVSDIDANNEQHLIPSKCFQNNRELVSSAKKDQEAQVKQKSSDIPSFDDAINPLNRHNRDRTISKFDALGRNESNDEIYANCRKTLPASRRFQSRHESALNTRRAFEDQMKQRISNNRLTSCGNLAVPLNCCNYDHAIYDLGIQQFDEQGQQGQQSEVFKSTSKSVSPSSSSNADERCYSGLRRSYLRGEPKKATSKELHCEDRGQQSCNSPDRDRSLPAKKYYSKHEYLERHEDLEEVGATCRSCSTRWTSSKASLFVETGESVIDLQNSRSSNNLVEPGDWGFSSTSEGTADYHEKLDFQECFYAKADYKIR